MRKLTRQEQYEHWVAQPQELRELEYQAHLRHYRMRWWLRVSVVLMILTQIAVVAWSFVD